MMDGWNAGFEGISIRQIQFLSSCPHYSIIPIFYHSMRSRTEMTNGMTKMIQNFLEARLTVEKNPAKGGVWESLDRFLKGWQVFSGRAYSASTLASSAMAILLFSSLKSKDLIT